MTDAGEPDDKILCVPLRDPHYSQITTSDDLPVNMLEEIKEFFRVYKNLEEKKVVIQGFESLDLAIELIEKSIKEYKKKFLDG
ncbi:MAG: inorganic diphosphatase [bacterium]